MKKFIALAILGLVLLGGTAGTVYLDTQAALADANCSIACDWSAHAANATPVVACTNPNCATEEQTTQQPAGTPEPAAPTVVTEEPPGAPVSVAECGNGAC